MAEEFTMPKLGLTMTDGTIREWLVEDGAFVQAGEPILVIETDKVETEVEVRSAGILRLAGVVGSTYECGAVIGYLLDEAAAPDMPEPAAAAASATPGLMAVPDLNEPSLDLFGDAEPARVDEGLFEADDEAEAAEVVEAVEIDRLVPAAAAGGPLAPAGAAPDIAARGAGGRILASPRARATSRDAELPLATVAGTGPGGRIVHDDVVAAIAARALAARALAARALAARALAERVEGERLEAERLEVERREAAAAEADRLAALPPPPSGNEPAQPELVEPARERPSTRAASQAQVSLPALDAAAPSQSVAATGGARLLADFLGVDLADVAPMSGGRITREDVGAWVRERLAPAPGSVATAASPTAAATNETGTGDGFAPLLQEPTEVVSFNGVRGLIAQRMHSSLNDMAQLTLSVDVDMAGVHAERERRRSQGQQVPGYTAWVVSAAAQAIEKHRYINSQITADGIALLPDVHVGVAVALDEGLIVPVIEHANLRTVEETHAVVADLAGRARVGKLQFQELEGATFSVTALGMYGVDMFTPVINPPNTAILGVGRVRSETGWSDGRPVEKTVMTLSLTWDHRAFDGAPAAEFAQTIVRLLQRPTELV